MSRLLEIASIVLAGSAFAIVASIPWLVDRFGLRIHVGLVFVGFVAFLLALALGVLSTKIVGYLVAGVAGASVLCSVYVYLRGRRGSSSRPRPKEPATFAGSG